jgi:hypothetical protein
MNEKTRWANSQNWTQSTVSFDLLKTAAFADDIHTPCLLHENAFAGRSVAVPLDCLGDEAEDGEETGTVEARKQALVEWT